MFEQIDQLASQARADLEAVEDADDLERFRVRYLGGKGAVKELTKSIKSVPADDRPAFGQRVNELRQKLQEAFDEKKARLAASAERKGPAIDLTEPGLPPRLGRVHVLRRTVDELLEVFARMGFDAADGPEVEDEHHNFVALNIPESHPARDPWDNFYLAEGGDAGGPFLLRTQTSTVQIRVMENAAPPIRVVSAGRVYRPDEHDATHSSMFHQLEGLYVDEGVSLADLKTTLLQFARAYFGPDAEVSLVPSYFPFTEPSAELYVNRPLPDGGREWLEVGGCGVVDPAVFEQVGYDPERYTGFAFGLGIDRLAMIKHGVDDIRLFYENDVRFLRQF